MSNIRYTLRQLLAADTGVLVPLLPGGIYPIGTEGPEDQTAISRESTPAAFGDDGDVLACALIAEESAVRMPPYPTSTLGAVRVWLYQQYGRDQIESAQQRIAILLGGARVVVDSRYRTLRFAGYGPSGVKEPALRDASVGWVRFQTNGLLALPD